MGLMPAVDLVEAFTLQYLCCERLPGRLLSRRRSNDELNSIEEGELESFTGESTDASNDMSPLNVDGVNTPNRNNDTHSFGYNNSKPRRNSHSSDRGNLKTMGARLMSVFAVSSVLMLLGVMTGLLVIQSLRRVKDNWEVYRRGALFFLPQKKIKKEKS